MNRLRDFLRNVKFKGRHRIIRLFDRPGGKNQFVGIIPYKKMLIHCDTSRLMDWRLYWDRGYENDVIWILEYFLTKSSVCLDIGANMGIYTLPMAKYSECVHAIEPHPEFMKRLKKNLLLNKLKNVTCYEIAIYNEEKTMTLYSPGENMHNKSASLYPENYELTEKISVQTVTLDRFCKTFKKLDFIKIDTDGSDARVILSGKEIIEKHKPIILFEYTNSVEEFEHKIKEAIGLLTRLGYELYVVKEETLEVFQKARGENVVAIPAWIRG